MSFAANNVDNAAYFRNQQNEVPDEEVIICSLSPEELDFVVKENERLLKEATERYQNQCAMELSAKRAAQKRSSENV